VSPYRLAAHLTSAFAIYSGLFWTALSVVSPYPTVSGEAGRAAMKVRRFAVPVAAIVGLTAISGAFVAGNDAVSFSPAPHIVYWMLTLNPYMPQRSRTKLRCSIKYDFLNFFEA